MLDPAMQKGTLQGVAGHVEHILAQWKGELNPLLVARLEKALALLRSPLTTELFPLERMTVKEYALAAFFLQNAASEFANHGCNDMPQEALAAAGFTAEEARTFVQDFHLFNHSRAETSNIRQFSDLSDVSAMHLLAHKLQRNSQFLERFSNFCTVLCPECAFPCVGLRDHLELTKGTGADTHCCFFGHVWHHGQNVIDIERSQIVW